MLYIFPNFPKIIIGFSQVHLTSIGSGFLKSFSVELRSKILTIGDSRTMIESTDYRK